MNYKNADMYALMCERDKCAAELAKYAKSGLSLDLSRGKPSAEQLALSLNMLDVLDHRSILDSESGQDCRNYGGLDGIEEAKRLLSHMMGTHSVNTIVGGNSSLTMMYELVSHGMTDGICGAKPWQEIKNRKFLCPAPGYDRHFAITEYFGFELIPVGMNDEGPNMDEVDELIKDPAVKGIWCVPKYQNPTGIVFSPETVRRFAALKPAAEDFRIFWDNAYCIHAFDGENAEIPDIISECEKAGNADLVYGFCSTSKITFPGAGISVMACSEANQAYMQKLMGIQMISYDKVNQQRHVLYLKDKATTLALMQRHAAILGPRFRAVTDALDREIAPLGIAHWTHPKGGYFVSLDALPGTARRTLQLCKEAGVTMTGAGAAFPYGKDPQDSNIRVAPSLPPVEELEQAIQVLCACLKLSALEEYLK